MNLLLSEQILSIKSRPNLMKDFRILGKNENITEVFFYFEKNDREGQTFPYKSGLPWRCIHFI